MAQPVRVGILGLGNIVRRVMTDFFNSKEVCLTAVASRSLEKAQEAAQKYGAKYAFGSYEELARCNEVDLVYIATPHPFHCQQAIMMMEHGKHVLCEKPIALNGKEVRAMVECAEKNGVFLMEAMWTRYFPAMDKLRQLIGAGEIGDIHHIYGVFSCSAVFDAESRLYKRELAGGALLDIGVYPLMFCTHILGWQPVKVQSVYCLTQSSVDERMSVQMQYASGATAQFMTALDAMAPSALHIYGSKGYVVIDEFWHPEAFEVMRSNGKREKFTFPAEHEGHHYEFDEAARCIRAGLRESPLMTWEESIAVCEITEKLRYEAGVFYPGEQG